ncbi:unnamed protein product [Symbiodinium natans]|uniref:Uncharacterized protein n=1 Tax=Symbiodinium natans TaxID=878477 RepID=A0A812U0T8_9DINO|nr:unnamed protein product [Symbiodinium natans]
MKLLFNAGLWLTKRQRDAAIKFLGGALQKYEACAQFAFDTDLCTWKIQPKFHLAGEVLYAFRVNKLNRQATINPVSYATQLDEDFVGRVSTISRYVASRTLHERTIRKYLLALKSMWESE